jgi:hypothetical protein
MGGPGPVDVPASFLLIEAGVHGDRNDHSDLARRMHVMCPTMLVHPDVKAADDPTRLDRAPETNAVGLSLAQPALSGTLLCQ